MRIDLNQVSKGRRGLALPETSLTYRGGEARLALAETEQRPTVLGLIASGRMRPETGQVLIDGRRDDSDIRRRVALVDAPDVCDPAPNVSLYGLVAEELMFAGRHANPLAARTWLTENGMETEWRTPVADLSPARRLRTLLELTVLRRGVEAVVLVSPDRHGGSPHTWWDLAEEFAGRGFGVLVIAGAASGTVLADRATLATEPVPTASATEENVR
ncbi:hypothetical protein [Microbacterium sp. SORGH_AS_0888]|uniref:hypothetical protein n=1 Tax=Microbacterium sp. SORGH_AS_0888 TaxID=3041791 RepID=UPI002784C085|nr:hypothetical protein [Microbacterium sp. SORGH_AS_0888]MDQ1129956.1 hypothetical protein [Microbacterium sp. SORGH_AS_0888]